MISDYYFTYAQYSDVLTLTGNANIAELQERPTIIHPCNIWVQPRKCKTVCTINMWLLNNGKHSSQLKRIQNVNFVQSSIIVLLSNVLTQIYNKYKYVQESQTHKKARYLKLK